jgi:ribose/xylose/arabinose/galactoside ABC-type transport system permease subunit
MNNRTRTLSSHAKNDIMELIMIGLIVILDFTAPSFFTVTNLLNILRNISMQGVIAFGMTLFNKD